MGLGAQAEGLTLERKGSVSYLEPGSKGEKIHEGRLHLKGRKVRQM